MALTFSRLRIPDVVLVEPKVLGDSRGFFAELFKASEFQSQGLSMQIVQVNQSRSQKHVVRGLHYQLRPKAQAKLVNVLRGEIFDVAVDIRRGSPTYGQWVGEYLSETNKRALFIPAGFAHGFCTVSDEAEIIYYCSQEYAAPLERSLLWNDPEIGIDWPVHSPILSSRDAAAGLLSGADNNFLYGQDGAS